ncbi:MAG: DegV family protein, partial [Lachnospira sp.]|nr:DegV family protein [Lachnospira sp.]
TLENLKRGGRISAASTALGTVLNIKPVLKFDVSTLDVYQKCRGFNKARKVMIEAMKNDLNTKFEKWYKAGKVNLLAASSASPEVTKEWEAQIREEFPGMDVRCDDLSMGVACHIGYGGLGIGCSCCPDAALD